MAGETLASIGAVCYRNPRSTNRLGIIIGFAKVIKRGAAYLYRKRLYAQGQIFLAKMQQWATEMMPPW
jgi:hypothetical protein